MPPEEKYTNRVFLGLYAELASAEKALAEALTAAKPIASAEDHYAEIERKLGLDPVDPASCSGEDAAAEDADVGTETTPSGDAPAGDPSAYTQEPPDAAPPPDGAE
jgi:hypothetical protein